MDIKNASFKYNDDYPVIRLTIDGEPVLIDIDQMSWRDGAIFIGSQFQGIYSVTLPANPENGRPTPWTLDGFTDDPRILTLYSQLRAECDNETFRPRRVSIPD